MSDAPQQNSSKAGQLAPDIILALAILYLIWGSTYLAIAFAVEDLPPYFMLAVRFVLAGLLMYGYVRLRGEHRATRSQLLGSAAVGALLLVGGMGSVALAQSFGAPSGLAAVMVATMPLWLALLLSFGGERTGKWEYVGMGLGLVGVVLLNLDAGLRSNPLAALLLLLAPFSWALGSALSRRLPQAQGSLGSAVQMFAAGVLFVPLSWLRGEQFPGTPSTSAVLALGYLVIFGSLVGFSSYVYLLNKRTRPALLTSYAYVNPVVAILLGAAFAGERFGWESLTGMAVVVIGVVVVLGAGASRR